MNKNYTKQGAQNKCMRPPELLKLTIWCVCVFLASGYEWVTVMHEIPISSAQSMTSFHTLGLCSTTPLVPLERGLYQMRRFQRVCNILDRTPWQLLGGQFHNLGSAPCHNVAKYSQPCYTHWYVLWLTRGFYPPTLAFILGCLRCQGPFYCQLL
jgi:hypothetical protein